VLQKPGEVQGELREVASEAERGLDMINHLLTFARMERGESKPLDLHDLVNSLLEIREHERELKGIRAENALPLSPIQVLVDRAQLEQAVLTVLVHAEHAAAGSVDKTIRVTSRVIGKRVQVFFDCSHTGTENPFENMNVGDFFGLPVAQAIAQSHSGDIRFVSTRTGCRLEVELPVHQPVMVPSPQQGAAKPARVLTALIVEPDVITQRKLLAMLSVRGHRAIPAPNAEDAADLVQRMQFDIVFCGVRLPGLNWVEFFQRIRRRIGAFALMTEGYDSDSARAFKGGEGHVLPRPLEDRDLDQFLGIVEVRLAASRR
jgi:CheY-like chemotaxis protein